MSKLKRIFFFSFILSINSIEIVDEYNTLPYYEFNWLKNKEEILKIKFATTNTEKYTCGLYNESRFCVAKQCSGQGTDEIECSFEGNNCLAESKNPHFQFYYDVICGIGLPNESGNVGSNNINIISNFSNTTYNKVYVSVAINYGNFIKCSVILTYIIFHLIFF